MDHNSNNFQKNTIFVAGHHLQTTFKWTDLLVPKMFALDPAKPLFTEKKHSERLDATDADYVEVIFISNLFKCFNLSIFST